MLRERFVTAKSLFSRGIPLDPRPDLLVDHNPNGKGVGPWVPKHKHRLLTDYIHGTRNAWKSSDGIDLGTYAAIPASSQTFSSRLLW